MYLLKELSNIAFDQINIVIKSVKDSDDIIVTIKPHNFSGDEAFDNLKAISVTGDAVEIEENFVELIQKPAKMLKDNMQKASDYIKEVEQKSKETKAEKEKKEKAKKAIESAEKITKAEDFDVAKDGKKAIEKYEKALEIDNTNSTAKKGLEQLKKDLAKQSNTLF